MFHPRVTISIRTEPKAYETDGCTGSVFTNQWREAITLRYIFFLISNEFYRKKRPMGTCEGGVKERGGRNAKLNSNRLREKKKNCKKKFSDIEYGIILRLFSNRNYNL